MFELSDTLVGIYKVSDCTQQCTIKNNTAEGQHQKNISSQRSRITQNQDQPDFTFNDNFLRPSQPVRQYQKQLSIINGSNDNPDLSTVNETVLENTMDTEIATEQLEENNPSVINTAKELEDSMEVSRVDSGVTNSDSIMDTSFDEPPEIITVTAQINFNN